MFKQVCYTKLVQTSYLMEIGRIKWQIIRMMLKNY